VLVPVSGFRPGRSRLQKSRGCITVRPG